MIKLFRAWDGQEYWYANKDLIFLSGDKYCNLVEAPFDLSSVEQFTGKIDYNKVQIFENDLIMNNFQDSTKIFQVIWSPNDCGFRKVLFGQNGPITPIDEAFMEVIGTIHSHKP